MQVIRSASEIAGSVRRACLAIGFFDGVHLGHEQLIRQTVFDARQHEGVSVVVTFDRHPATVVAPDRVPPLIYTESQRLRAIEGLGVDFLRLLPFDESFSRQTGEQFIRQMAADWRQVVSICVGASFEFGHRRSGNVPLLRTLGSELGFNVHGHAVVALDGEPVSSTRIREAIRGGRLDDATQMLGRPYSLAGTVVQGAQLGRKLGVPTANLDIAGRVLPPNGVYAAHAETPAGTCRAVVNIGVRPTLATQTPTVIVEAHLLDFDGNLYGQEVELTFVEQLRDEQRFPSLDALRAQIDRDIAHARRLFDS